MAASTCPDKPKQNNIATRISDCDDAINEIRQRERAEQQRQEAERERIRKEQERQEQERREREEAERRRQQEQRQREIRYGKNFTVNGVSFTMILVEGGTFRMGGTDEQGNDCETNEMPPHEETVKSFYIGKYEVTQRLWNAVIGSEHNSSYNQGCDDCPVEKVSWNDAQAFIAKLSILTKRPFRLPTEVEWEYAARGGKRSKGYKYSGSHNIDEVAWYVGNYQESKYGNMGTTHPVGMKKPNELGVYDMSGNVWEWCLDWYAADIAGLGGAVNMAAGTSRVLRGGSWDNDAGYCRAARRLDGAPANRYSGFGFRLALPARPAGLSQE